MRTGISLKQATSWTPRPYTKQTRGARKPTLSDAPSSLNSRWPFNRRAAFSSRAPCPANGFWFFSLSAVFLTVLLAFGVDDGNEDTSRLSQHMKLSRQSNVNDDGARNTRRKRDRLVLLSPLPPRFITTCVTNLPSPRPNNMSQRVLAMVMFMATATAMIISFSFIIVITFLQSWCLAARYVCLGSGAYFLRY